MGDPSMPPAWIMSSATRASLAIAATLLSESVLGRNIPGPMYRSRFCPSMLRMYWMPANSCDKPCMLCRLLATNVSNPISAAAKPSEPPSSGIAGIGGVAPARIGRASTAAN